MTEQTKLQNEPGGQLAVLQVPTADQIRSIHKLANDCNQHDGIALKLHKTMIENRTAGEERDFLWQNAEGELVGYVGLNSFQPDSAEIVAMVHPNDRRQGIFTRLMKEAGRSCEVLGIKKLLLICPGGSESGKAFTAGHELEHSFSEYVMKWSSEAQTQTDPSASRIQLRLGEQADLELAIRMDMKGFDMTREDTEPFAKLVLECYPKDRIYFVYREQEPIGKICIQRTDERAFFFGFAILPDHRGQGYGREVLRESIRLVRDEGCTEIGLEVEIRNERALGLYESCGFHQVDVQDYYVYLT
ncbi:GNAT family N-acetyltransferase [Gorillibacterium sp. CAU 1737]|uniref:GNAT family N-acetyltransferase n=1 Tax=Gorillibacterium sp. CAU 1737 TaxID=3140362 RepID=UPI0032613726